MDNEHIIPSLPVDEANDGSAAPQLPVTVHQQPEKPRRVRRVGTLTMGIALVIVGLALCATMLLPAKDILMLAKLSPLLLVAIGIEVVIASVKNDGSKIKYDFLSFFMCLFLIVGSLCAMLIPYVVEYIGPEREIASASISDDISNTLLTYKDNYPDVYRITVNTTLSGMRKFEGTETAKDIMRGDWVSVYAELNGNYKTKEEFAEAVLPLYNAVRKISPSYIQMSAQSTKNNKDPMFAIELGGGTYISLTSKTLAQNVTKYMFSEEYGSYESEENFGQLTNSYEQTIKDLRLQIEELQNQFSQERDEIFQSNEENVNNYEQQINDLQNELQNLQNENQSLHDEVSNLQNG